MPIPVARQHSPVHCRTRTSSRRPFLACVIGMLFGMVAGAPAAVAAEPPPALVDRSAELDVEARLDTILSLALTRNPELAQSSARSEAARAMSQAASRLPDPELEYQLWAAPLARPYAFDEAEMHMFGLRQAFPAWGSLEARGLAAREQAGVVAQERRLQELELVARVRRAYADYRLRSRELELHREHALLARQMLEAVRAAYQGGRASQGEVLRATLELSRLHRDVATLERERDSARGMLNTLMARRVNAPLGPPSPLVPGDLDVGFAALSKGLVQHRPELAAVDGVVRAREHELDAARANARFPTFMLGAQYMYMPASDAPHDYGLMFSMSLPWFNPRYGEEVRAAEATVKAERSARASLQNTLGLELYTALQRFSAARESWRSAEQSLIPLAEQSYQAAQASYRSGQGDVRSVLDSLGDLLELRVERERTIAEWDSALAELERAAGSELRPTEK